MPLIEKHGALWFDDPDDVRTRPVYEQFDEYTGLLAVVHRSPFGHLVALIYEKIKDPQWGLPFWGERRPEALFNDESEAVNYVENLLRAQRSI
jgi:hypothetical protein